MKKKQKKTKKNSQLQSDESRIRHRACEVWMMYLVTVCSLWENP